MTRSRELFELLAGKARARAAEAEAQKEKAAAAASSVVPAETTKKKSTSMPAAETRRASRSEADATRPPLAVPRSVAAPDRAPAEAAAPDAPRVAAPDAIVLSRPGATLLGVLGLGVVVAAFLAGERVGAKGAGGIGSQPITTLAPSESAKAPSVPDADVGRSEPVPAPAAAKSARAAGDATFGVRVVTYEFNFANGERAREIEAYLKSQGLRDVDVVTNSKGTELRIYAGRYSSDEDPALLTMRETVRALPGDGKGKKEARPFRTAYIMARGD